MTVWIRGTSLGDFRVRVGIAAVIVCSTWCARSLIRRNGPEPCARCMIVFVAPCIFSGTSGTIAGTCLCFGVHRRISHV
jgi:hypothetical protein